MFPELNLTNSRLIGRVYKTRGDTQVRNALYGVLINKRGSVAENNQIDALLNFLRA